MPEWLHVGEIAVTAGAIIVGCVVFGSLAAFVLDPQIDPKAAIRRWWRRSDFSRAWWKAQQHRENRIEHHGPRIAWPIRKDVH